MLVYTTILKREALLDYVEEGFSDVGEGDDLCILVDSGDMVVGVGPHSLLHYVSDLFEQCLYEWRLWSGSDEGVFEPYSSLSLLVVHYYLSMGRISKDVFLCFIVVY